MLDFVEVAQCSDSKKYKQLTATIKRDGTDVCTTLAAKKSDRYFQLIRIVAQNRVA